MRTSERESLKEHTVRSYGSGGVLSCCQPCRPWTALWSTVHCLVGTHTLPAEDGSPMQHASAWSEEMEADIAPRRIDQNGQSQGQNHPASGTLDLTNPLNVKAHAPSSPSWP